MSPQNTPQYPSDLDEQLSRIAALTEEGHYDGAIALCDELLRSHPHSIEVRTAMGDIYAARQLWPEAIEWYELAQELGDDPEVADRLEQARQQMEAQREGGRRPAPAAPEIVPPTRPRRRISWGATLAIIGASLLVVLAVFVLLARGPESQRRQPRTAGSVQGPVAPRPMPQPRLATSLPQTTPPSTTPGQPTTVPGAPASGFTGATTAPKVSGPTVARAPVVITRKLSGPASDRDLYLAQTVGSLTWPNGRSMSRGVSAVMDPYTGYAIITFEVPAGVEGDELRQIVATQAYKAAVVAFRSDTGLDSLTIRALALVKSADGQERSIVAFRANTDRVTMEYWLRIHGEPDLEVLWNDVFAEAWWNPGVTPETLR